MRASAGCSWALCRHFEKQLNRSQIAGLAVDLRRLGAAHRMRAVGAAVHPGAELELVPTLADKGLEKKRSARAQKLAEIPVKKIVKIAATLADAGKAVSPSAILAAQRRENKTTKVHEVAQSAFSSDGPFGTVCAL